MKLDRKEILKALETISIAGEGKNMVESGAVKNVMTFADEIVVDLVLSSPAMHIKKRAEADVIKTIKEKVSEGAKVTVNIKIEAPVKPSNPNLIKGKNIPKAAYSSGENFSTTISTNCTIVAIVAIKRMNVKKLKS